MNMNQNMPMAQQPEVDLKQTTNFYCEKCAGQSFQEAIMFRKVSALLSKTGKEMLYPIGVFACVNCGNVNDIFIPKELKTTVLV
jgi:uncharacterized Zn finger protein